MKFLADVKLATIYQLKFLEFIELSMQIVVRFFHEICRRILENSHMFHNYCKLIKNSIANNIKKYSTSDILKMEKHECCQIMLNNILI